MFNFTNNNKSINDISIAFKEENLIVDDSYQRRSIWGEKDKIRLIETILLHLIIPQLFFWKAETDPETGISITHIVDGQQRIKAICSFIDNEFKLKQQYLLDEDIKVRYGDKTFKEFDSETKKDFWNYQLMIIDIDPKATRDDIITMFNRLNLTDYSLNDQEKRNSRSGEFGILATEVSDNEFWEEYHIFTISDVKRMRDVEFCASIILLNRKGIIDQTDQSALNEAYEELQTGYEDAESDKEAVLAAIEQVPHFMIDDATKKFLHRKAQLYTLFCVIFYINREKLSLSQVYINNFKQFVQLYSIFKNDMDLSQELTDQEKILFDKINKYKLASSEGLNKHTNRMIRYNIMKDFIFEQVEDVKSAMKTLYDKVEAYGEGVE